MVNKELMKQQNKELKEELETQKQEKDNTPGTRIG